MYIHKYIYIYILKYHKKYNIYKSNAYKETVCAYTHIYMQTFQHLWIIKRYFLRSQLRYDQLKNILTGLVAAKKSFPFSGGEFSVIIESVFLVAWA